MPHPTLTISTLTPEAKDALRRTIRALRERLAVDLRAEAESAYGLSRTDASGLPEAARERRARLVARVDERVRCAPAAELKKSRAAVRERVLGRFVLEAAHTLVNRLVLLRHMEALSVGRPRAQRLLPIDVVTKGWQSPAYRAWREHAAELCEDARDGTEGYAALLALVFHELARDLPGLYGDVGLTRLFPIPPATLRAVVEALNDPALDSAWTDDTTLGWVYQYWNDPDREALDVKIAGGGKIEPHEIASKTQMFTERYMVEWLLQNSLGLTWLAMCKKHGWTADADRILPVLEARRAEWRARREAGEVALDALMPLANDGGELEEHWKYYVLQPIPDDAVEKAPASVRELKLLDPACGSGHFLVIAFGLLAALYREESRHLSTTLTDQEIAESILENNLHGIDIDPRAIQIAAAGLYVKAKSLSSAARPKKMNLVAPVFQLGNLPADDPAIVHLRHDLKRDVGIPEELTTRLLSGLAGVDYLGSLLKVDAAVEGALASVELEFQRERGQGSLFGGFPTEQVKLTAGEAKATVLDKLEAFLGKHSGADDLGLRLDGEQLAAGVRFVRMVREGSYDVVVGNPPYQGLSKTASFEYVAKDYPRGKADLYAAFLERGLELARPGGISALLTMRGWMFLGQFAELRKHMLKTADLRLLGDVDRGAFEDVPDEVLATVMSLFRRGAPSEEAVALQPTPPEDRSRDGGRTNRKRAAVLAQVGRHEFDPRGFEVIEGEPIVYWWSRDVLSRYAAGPKLGARSPVRQGLGTRDDTRFLRKPWEPAFASVARARFDESLPAELGWVPNVKGASGRTWIEPLSAVVRWHQNAIELRTWIEEYRKQAPGQYIKNESFYFQYGIAFVMIGAEFSARAHRFKSVFGEKGSSVFPRDVAASLCSMNSTFSRKVLESLNPTICFQVGDVVRVPVENIDGSSEIFGCVQGAFAARESAREASVEFRRPGPSAWTYAQAWAQLAVDRPEGAPLPPYEPVYEPASPADFVSFAVGVALGRFPLDASPVGASGAPGAVLGSPPGALTPSPSPWGEGSQSESSTRDGVSVPAPLSLGRGAGGEGLSPGAEALSTGGEGLSAGGEGLAPGADALSGRNRSIPAGLLRLARDLRERQTPAEDFLWQCLRDRQLNGAKFRRQHNIGRFIVDFYCHEARLVIELDGSVHEGREEQDGARQRWLEAAGLRVLRFSNDRVDLDLLEVLWEILKATGAPREAHGAPPGALTPSPSPSRGEGSQSESTTRDEVSLPAPLSLGRGAGGEGPSAGGEGLSAGGEGLSAGGEGLSAGGEGLSAGAEALSAGAEGLSAGAEGSRESLPHGILFLSAASEDDSLTHPACVPLHAAFAEHGASLAGRDDLRTWLRTKLFADHKSRYENRPIYFPLSSEKKSFVAWVSIHRWQHDTLQVLLADHLKREETRLEGQLADLNRARTADGGGAKKAEAEKRYRDVQRLLDELVAFIASVRAIAEEGPPPTDPKCPPREVNARFAMDLDDGVMVNSAALWPLLEPQWKDPKKWWKELATAQGKKDYDWAHLAARYFPTRVEAKCQEDPSLAVAHKRFWRLHPAKAFAWELRLQDEIREGFTIDEPGSDEARAAFLRERPAEAEAARRTEETRRARKKAKADAGAQAELEGVRGEDEEGEGREEDVEG